MSICYKCKREIKPDPAFDNILLDYVDYKRRVICRNCYIILNDSILQGRELGRRRVNGIV